MLLTLDGIPDGIYGYGTLRRMHQRSMTTVHLHPRKANLASKKIVGSSFEPKSHAPGGLQSAERVIDIFEYLALTQRATTNEIATALEVHKSVVYRLLKTLEARGFVNKENSHYTLGTAFLAMADSVPEQLRPQTDDILKNLTKRTEATSYIVVESGNRSICLRSIEPQGLFSHTAIRPGASGPMDKGAPAIAIRSGKKPQESDSQRVLDARDAGYAIGVGPNGQSFEWLASPIILDPNTDATACVGIVRAANGSDIEDLAHLVKQAASAIAAKGRL